MIKIILVAVVLLATSCTPNTLAKEYGGTATQEIPCDTRVVTVTWKNADLWILLRELKPGEQTERYLFKEASNYGILNGEVRIQEHRCNQ